MKWTHIIWDDSPGGNVEHVEEHDLTVDDIEFVLENYERAAISKSSGRPCVFGFAPDGRYIIVIFDEIDEATIVPVTAYKVDEA